MTIKENLEQIWRNLGSCSAHAWSDARKRGAVVARTIGHVIAWITCGFFTLILWPVLWLYCVCCWIGLRLWKLAWGLDIPFHECAKNGILEAITLLGAVLAASVALIGALHEAGKQPGFVGLYVGGVLIPLGAMMHMIFAKNIDKDSKIHRAYDQATIGFTRMGSLLTALLVLFVAVQGFGGNLPGQKPPQPKLLPVREVTNSTWDYDKKPKIIVQIEVSNETYPEGIPDWLDLSIRLDKKLQEDKQGNWAIWTIDLFEARPGEGKVPVQSIQAYTGNESPYEKHESFANFHRVNHTYYLEVALHPSKPITDKQTNWAKIIKEERGLLVTDSHELHTAGLPHDTPSSSDRPIGDRR